MLRSPVARKDTENTFGCAAAAAASLLRMRQSDPFAIRSPRLRRLLPALLLPAGLACHAQGRSLATGTTPRPRLPRLRHAAGTAAGAGGRATPYTTDPYGCGATVPFGAGNTFRHGHSSGVA